MYAMIRYASPLGELRVAADEEAVVALTIAGQKYETEHLPPDAIERETPPLAAARRWLDAYFAGQRPETGMPPLAPRGTDFQRRVWRALLEIPCGETRSYGELARALGSSPRAVGGAVGRNPVSILIPCHRVTGADGSLTGYAGGIGNKRLLLRLEGARED